MSEFIETPAVSAVISLDSATADSGQEALLLTVLLENGKTVRLPIPFEQAARVSALLLTALRARGLEAPTGSVRRCSRCNLRLILKFEGHRTERV